MSQHSLDTLKQRYPKKVTTAARAANLVQAGNRVFVGTGCATPRALVAALESMAHAPPDVELVHFVTTNAVAHDKNGQALTRYRHRSFFVGSDMRAAARQGLVEYVPIQISKVPALFENGSLPIDVALIQVSAPDAFGYVSLGVSVDIIPSAVAAAKLVIAEVNAAMPRTQGDTTLHLKDIDKLVVVHTPVQEYRHHGATEKVVQQIAKYIAGIIDDGSTLQIGLGRIPNEALAYLSDRKDLGLHSDVVTDAILPLLQKGILTGRAKSQQKSRIVASFVLGSRALYDIMDGNPLFSLHPMEWVANQEVIAAQHKMVSISQAFSIDLTGQVCSDQFEGLLYGGLGAQVDFVRGAARSKGGKPIVCIPSTTEDGRSSRIRALLAPGEAATLARSDVHYIVTEFGIAYLHGKSIRERALSLIAVAHPQFRDALLDEAKQLGFLEQSCTIASVFPYPVEDEVDITLRNGQAITLRPATVSDAAGIKALFYGLPQNDRYTRFFRQVQALSTDEVQKLCNLDYKQAVAFVAVHGAREHETLVGHASYFVNPSTNLAESAFMVSNSWQGTGLGSALQQRLVGHAKARGIRGFQAEILPENTKMIRLARSCCDNVSVTRDEDAVHITMLF
jgi:acyl-CoA hydrolase/RimJ/RimL family protein N-acetyltransferase